MNWPPQTNGPADSWDAMTLMWIIRHAGEPSIHPSLARKANRELARRSWNWRATELDNIWPERHSS